MRTSQLLTSSMFSTQRKKEDTAEMQCLFAKLRIALDNYQDIMIKCSDFDSEIDVGIDRIHERLQFNGKLVKRDSALAVNATLTANALNKGADAAFNKGAAPNKGADASLDRGADLSRNAALRSEALFKRGAGAFADKGADFSRAADLSRDAALSREALFNRGGNLSRDAGGALNKGAYLSRDAGGALNKGAYLSRDAALSREALFNRGGNLSRDAGGALNKGAYLSRDVDPYKEALLNKVGAALAEDASLNGEVVLNKASSPNGEVVLNKASSPNGEVVLNKASSPNGKVVLNRAGVDPVAGGGGSAASTSTPRIPWVAILGGIAVVSVVAAGIFAGWHYVMRRAKKSGSEPKEVDPEAGKSDPESGESDPEAGKTDPEVEKLDAKIEEGSSEAETELRLMSAFLEKEKLLEAGVEVLEEVKQVFSQLLEIDWPPEVKACILKNFERIEDQCDLQKGLLLLTKNFIADLRGRYRCLLSDKQGLDFKHRELEKKYEKLKETYNEIKNKSDELGDKLADKESLFQEDMELLREDILEGSDNFAPGV